MSDLTFNLSSRLAALALAVALTLAIDQAIVVEVGAFASQAPSQIALIHASHRAAG